LAGKLSCDDIKDFIQLSQNFIHDESRLKDFEKELLHRQKESERVDKIIDEWRSESDEAIRKLEEKLKSFDQEEPPPWLEIIVGAGRHSREKNKQNIRPKVEQFLKKRNLEFALVNKGSLVVTFQPYSGPEPCFGEYYCEKCDRCWRSSKSYVGKYQKCVDCKVNCWPVKQREKEKVEYYHRDGARSAKRQLGHQASLCQRCKEKGHPCNEDSDESDIE
jgi:DNA-binding transcriptional MerR regulator